MLGMQTILNAKFRSGQSFDNAICNNYINISAICKKRGGFSYGRCKDIYQEHTLATDVADTVETI